MGAPGQMLCMMGTPDQVLTVLQGLQLCPVATAQEQQRQQEQHADGAAAVSACEKMAQSEDSTAISACGKMRKRWQMRPSSQVGSPM
jgi:hypothetical protein